MSEEKTMGHGFFPMCLMCKHLDIQFYNERGIPRCKAFTEVIPLEFWDCKYDHRYPHPDDNGIQFEKVESIEELSVHVTAKTMGVVNQVLERTFKELEVARREGRALPPLEE